MGQTNFPNGITSYGVPVTGGGGGVMSIGGGQLATAPAKTFFCDPTNGLDSNDGLSPATAKAKLSAVHSVMTANQNDTVYVIGNSSASSLSVVAETATLVWSKNLCHIVGVNAFNRISHRVSIRSVTNDFTPLVSVTASGCVFANFHVVDETSSSAAHITWAETGQRNSHFNLHIATPVDQTAADDGGMRAMTISGDGERYFKDCTFGIDARDRAGAGATVATLSSAVRDVFEDCLFISRADTSSPTHLLIANGTLDRFILFKRCMFHNHGTTITEVANVGGSVGGSVILQDCHSIGATDWQAASISGQLYIVGVDGTATQGLMVNPT
jgi:hypothetical protein